MPSLRSSLGAFSYARAGPNDAAGTPAPGQASRSKPIA